MYALETDSVEKQYKNGVQALRGVSFSVKKGDFFALLGPNGAGKSTLIGILTSLIFKTKGRVHLLGYDIDTHFSEAKALIGVVPQEFNFGIFDRVIDILIAHAGYYGVSEKIALPRIEHHLKHLDLWHKRHSAARHLSGGMKRRLMIARALIHEPKMLILDEPTAGVDIELRHSMWTFLQEINQLGVTIILTTHYLEEAEHLCRHIAIIDHGKIITNSSMQALLSQLDSECFIFYLKEEMTILPKMLPEMSHVTLTQVDSKTLEVDVPKSIDLGEVICLLQAKGLQLHRIQNKKNRLETLFLRLTAEKRV